MIEVQVLTQKFFATSAKELVMYHLNVGSKASLSVIIVEDLVILKKTADLKIMRMQILQKKRKTSKKNKYFMLVIPAFMETIKPGI